MPHRSSITTTRSFVGHAVIATPAMKKRFRRWLSVAAGDA
jgi:hypothetical protein